MKKMHGYIFTVSMVLSFVSLAFLKNLEILNHEDISIMYWGFGGIVLWYLLLWFIVVKVFFSIAAWIKQKLNP